MVPFLSADPCSQLPTPNPDSKKKVPRGSLDKRESTMGFKLQTQDWLAHVYSHQHSRASSVWGWGRKASTPCSRRRVLGPIDLWVICILLRPTGPQRSWLSLNGTVGLDAVKGAPSPMYYIYAATFIFLGHLSGSNGCSLGFLETLPILCIWDPRKRSRLCPMQM